MSPEEKHPNDPNRGMNTKVFMAAVFAALLLLIIVAYFLLRATGGKEIPKANQSHPNSRLVMPSGSQTADAV